MLRYGSRSFNIAGLKNKLLVRYYSPQIAFLHKILLNDAVFYRIIDGLLQHGTDKFENENKLNKNNSCVLL
jgi:hypothetical protein